MVVRICVWKGTANAAHDGRRCFIMLMPVRPASGLSITSKRSFRSVFAIIVNADLLNERHSLAFASLGTYHWLEVLPSTPPLRGNFVDGIDTYSCDKRFISTLQKHTMNDERCSLYVRTIYHCLHSHPTSSISFRKRGSLQ